MEDLRLIASLRLPGLVNLTRLREDDKQCFLSFPCRRVTEGNAAKCMVALSRES